MQEVKTYHNPINGETTTILESSAETNGAYTFFEVTLNAGGGNPLHYHKGFTEEFFAVKGKLGLQKGKQTIYLHPGESALVPVGAYHRFFNDTSAPMTFRLSLPKASPILRIF